MPYVCDVRTSNANNVIEVNNKLFIETQEYTPTNLAPVAFSQGPTTYSPGVTTSITGANLTQLSMPRVYVRGGTGVFPTRGSAGMFDTSRISCGQEVLGSFVYSSTQNRYYGIAGSLGLTLGSFDSSFRLLSPGIGAAASGLSGGSAPGTYAAPGGLFLPPVNNRWIFIGSGSSTTVSVGTELYSTIAVLTEAGTYTAIRNVDSRFMSLPYIGVGAFNPDYLFAVHSPWTAYADPAGYQNTRWAVYRRDTGAEVVAPSNWITSTGGTVNLTNAQQAGTFPSNAIVDVPGNQFYFYHPTITASDLQVFIGTVTGMNSTPSLGAFATAYTLTANATTDEVNTAAFDVPNFSRVLFSNTGGALPAGLAASTWYWTVRTQPNFSKVATSYQNAIAGVTVDITTAGTGTNSMTVVPALNIADFTYYTVTADAGTDIVTTPIDIPNLTRVRFTNSGGALPTGISAGVDYWTVRQSSSTSKLATSYANAVNNATLDITGNGTGTTTIYVYTLASSSGDSNGIVTYPAGWSSAVLRCVRAWTFAEAGVNYLTIGVYEPGTSASVANAALNLYLYRLESKTTATFIQRLTLGDAGRVRSYMTLDSTLERMLVIYDDRIAYYAWNPATNWTLQSAQSIQTQNVGADSLGRVWVTTNTGDWNVSSSLFQSIYVYEPSGSAVNITLDFAQGSYSYTGTPISSSLTVNAYDVTGARVALSVSLTRTTTNFEFTGGAASTTVTTSTGGNTSVPISVFGTGLLSCRAAPT